MLNELSAQIGNNDLFSRRIHIMHVLEYVLIPGQNWLNILLFTFFGNVQISILSYSVKISNTSV